MSTYAIGGLVACVSVRTMGEGGQILSFWCVRTN